MTRGPAKTRRILVGATSFADAESALNLARHFAGEMASDLIGLLVEDLARIVEDVAPSGGLVTTSGQLIATPSREKLAQLIQSERRAFEASLATMAGSLSVAWSFEARTGTLEHALDTLGGDWDVLLIGHRKLHHRLGPVALIGEAGRGGERAARFARSLAAAMRLDVLALEVGATGMDLADAGHAAGPGPLRFADPHALLAHLSRLNATAVILDLSAGPFRTMGELREVLELARCPLVALADNGPDRS